MSGSDRSSRRVDQEVSSSQVGARGKVRSANDCHAPMKHGLGRRRVTAARVEAVREQLSGRDFAIARDVARVRMVSGEQLQRLHFEVGTPASRVRTAQRVLGRLVDLRVLSRLDRRIGGVRAGSAGFVYALDAVGQRLMTGTGAGGGRRVRRPWTPSGLFVDHTLGVTEVYVRLVEADRAGVLELLDVETEPTSWRRFVGADGAWATLKPDAYVRVGVDEFEDHWFLELNRSTEGPAALSRKLHVYRGYWASGREQAAHGVFPQVLFVVSTDARAEQVVDVLGRQPPESWRLFRVAKSDRLIATLTDTTMVNGAQASNRPHL
jgi:hypothetical protein